LRAGLFAVVLTAAICSAGSAQVLQLPAPAPAVTATRARWQIEGAPIFYAGNFYYPSGPTVFFDGYVMVRTGSYRGVPLYQDATLEPYSLVYVPIAGNLMRPYERRRVGELEGTTGSRAPSFPIEHDVDLSLRSTVAGGGEYPPLEPTERVVLPETSRSMRRTSPVQARSGAASPSTGSERPGPTLITVPPPESNRGVWIEFAGERWSSIGRAVAFSPGRFERIGTLDGFPVYRDRGSRERNIIYVPAVAGGPLAPFGK
jgi:hypothetical protein